MVDYVFYCPTCKLNNKFKCYDAPINLGNKIVCSSCGKRVMVVGKLTVLTVAKNAPFKQKGVMD